MYISDTSMQSGCFGMENKDNVQHGIVGYFTIWDDNS